VIKKELCVLFSPIPANQVSRQVSGATLSDSECSNLTTLDCIHVPVRQQFEIRQGENRFLYQPYSISPRPMDVERNWEKPQILLWVTQTLLRIYDDQFLRE
jgi:hypothetical protein